MRESLHVLEPGSQVQNAIYLAGVETVIRQLAAELDLSSALAGSSRSTATADRGLVT
jgi:hypothetical protein